MAKLIDSYMLKLLDAKFSPEQIKVVRAKMLDYALCACMDSDIRKEIMQELTPSRGNDGGNAE